MMENVQLNSPRSGLVCVMQSLCSTAVLVLWLRGSSMEQITEDTLFYGENLIILREQHKLKR
jgi:hypothetical protein